MLKRFPYSALIFCLLTTSIAQSQNDIGSWLIYKNKLSLNEKTSINTQYQLRSFSLDFSEDQTLITTGLSHVLLPNLSVAAGYRRLSTSTFLENGMYQKLALSSSFGTLKLTNTFMLEERWIDDDFALRYRIGFSLRVPLALQTAVIVSEEAFLQNTGTSFNQNRFTVKFVHTVSKKIQLTTGMMHWQFSNLKRWVLLATLSHTL